MVAGTCSFFLSGLILVFAFLAFCAQLWNPNCAWNTQRGAAHALPTRTVVCGVAVQLIQNGSWISRAWPPEINFGAFPSDESHSRLRPERLRSPAGGPQHQDDRQQSSPGGGWSCCPSCSFQWHRECCFPHPVRFEGQQAKAKSRINLLLETLILMFL